MPGSYTFRPIEANLTHNTEWIGKMSPYCAFQLGEKMIAGAVCKKGGKNPHWEDVVTMPASMSNNFIVNAQVMNKDHLTKDDLVGTFSVDLKEAEATGHISKWYPLFFKNKPAGEILLETTFNGQDIALESTGIKEETTFTQGGFTTGVEAETKIYQEQKQVVEPHTFMKEVDVVETVPVVQKIEVMEPVKVMKDVEYTEAVPVIKQIETIEPQVVKKQVEVIESKPVIREVETFEPQTFHKQVEVTEYVPVTKEVTVTEPVHVKKAVEYVEDVITTQTITKEVREPVVVHEEVKTTVGPATMIGTEDILIREKTEAKLIESEKIRKEHF